MVWNILEGPFAIEFCGEGIIITVFFDLGFMKMLSMLLPHWLPPPISAAEFRPMVIL